MRFRLVLALLVLPALAHAQFASILRFKNSGTLVSPARPYANCKGGIVCVDDPANNATDIDGSGVPGTTTLQQAYDNSAAANPSITLSPASGAIILKDTAGVGLNGTLFAINSNSNSTLFLISDGGAGSPSSMDSTGALNLGGANATAVNYGNGSVVHTFTGGSFVFGTGITITELSGKITKYATETTAGAGVPYIEAAGQDVVSSGLGIQNTNIANYTPTTASGGTYRISIVTSCSVNDTITITVTWTDAVDAFATTATPINGYSCTANSATDTTSATVIARANNSTAVSVQITNSGQGTTKASATIERLQ